MDEEEVQVETGGLGGIDFDKLRTDPAAVFGDVYRQQMAAQRAEDLGLFVGDDSMVDPAQAETVPFSALSPAFLTSELKTAFQIGFMVILPFLIIDLVVAAVLTALGMIMLPPQLVSLPLKLLLFVAVDGWHLLVGSLIGSF
jgi:flagellar biosynthetic protein FliP